MKVRKKFYVDDLNTGVNSLREGVELVKKIKVWFSEAQFNVRKFRSNSKELLTYFETLQNVNIINNTVNKEVVDSKINNEQKILGILWDEIEDNLIFRLDDIFKDATNVVPTKRNILSVISTVYDPVGYLQPFTIQLKILLQNICKLNINWDDLIGELLVEWKKISENLKRCEEIVIERCYFIYNLSDPIKEIYLHGFSDASQSAYAACIYLQSVTQLRNVTAKFVTAKSRVIPIKKSFTIPRLELLGNFILSKLICNIYNGICDDIEVEDILCWSDSQISLAWIKDINSEFKTFVKKKNDS